MQAIGYARISKDDTLEGRGVARQTEDIAAVCDRNGWELVEVITDNDISASRYSRRTRPGYERLVHLIEAGAVERAVVYDLDRLLRQPKELEHLIDLAESNGGFQVHSVAGQVDVSTGAGRFVARSLVAKAAMESDDISRRLRRSYDQLAQEGKPKVSKRGFGYETDGMTVREPEAELIRQAAADVLAGESLHEIARRWNRLGVFTPQRGVPWTSQVVRQVLAGPRIAGLRQHRGEVVGPAAWPAIVDRATHDAMVRLTTDRRRVRPPRMTAFTGLVRTVDGRVMGRNVQRGRAIYTPIELPRDVIINAAPLENLILAMLFGAVDDGTLAEIRAQRRQRAPQQPADDPAEIEGDLRALAADHGAGRISRGEWLAARGPLEDRLRRATAVAAATGPELALEGVEPGLRDRWPDLTVDRQRAILGAVFERIEIGPSARRGGPAPMVEDIGRIEVERVNPVWRV